MDTEASVTSSNNPESQSQTAHAGVGRHASLVAAGIFLSRIADWYGNGRSLTTWETHLPLTPCAAPAHSQHPAKPFW